LSADWSRLAAYLRRQPDQVTLSWRHLEELVGGVPASALDHAAWWGGDRPHTRAWRSAGFEVVDRRPGVSITFARGDGHRPDSVEKAASLPEADKTVDGAEVILVSCSKQKRPQPAPARELYTSPLFQKARRYAETSGKPWFILSAEHGLVAPDEWLAPYERYLADTPSSFRRAWAAWVAARLELLTGELSSRVFEIHAGRTYVDTVAPALSSRGAGFLLPLDGLAQGERLAWYNDRYEGGRADGDGPGEPSERTRRSAEDPRTWAARLSDPGRSLTPAELTEGAVSGLGCPGLYSWWVDEAGASDLAAGLGVPLAAGLIYAGQAGATRWPSGRASTNTLRERLVGMHLGKRADFSTFRLTLGSILRAQRGWTTIDETELTGWMFEHLRVVPLPHPDGDTLGDLEKRVLDILDPPLNLRGMAGSEVRSRLKKLRGASGANGE
jgi:hypothetical protein